MTSGADRDLGAVIPEVEPQVYTIVTAKWKAGRLLNVNRQPDSNTMEVAREVHAQLDRIRKALPPGVEITPFYDQSIIVDESIKSVRDAILIGLVLASVILVIFLHDWGTSIVAGLVIPVTILVTFVVLKLLDQNFNLMTLGRVGGRSRLGHRRCHPAKNIVMHPTPASSIKQGNNRRCADLDSPQRPE